MRPRMWTTGRMDEVRSWRPGLKKSSKISNLLISRKLTAKTILHTAKMIAKKNSFIFVKRVYIPITF